MASDAPETMDQGPVEHVVIKPPLWQRVAKWTAVVAGGVVLLLGALILGVNTQPGRDLLVKQINKYTMASGLNFQVGRIEGSLYGAMVLRDVRVRDPKGVFASANELAVDWRPFSYLHSQIDIRSLTSPEVRILRLPELKQTPSDPNAPLLPDINLDIGRLDISRIDVAPAVDGQRHIASLRGSAHLADGRAQINANAGTIAAPGVAGGDRVTLKLDAVPEQNKLDIDMRLDAPAKGLVAGLAGLDRPVTFAVGGKGSWKDWRGRAVGTLGGRQLADLSLIARDGRFQLRGPTYPGVYMEGPVERLASPQLNVEADAVLADRKVNGTYKFRSDALSVEAKGLIDLGQNRFGNFNIDALLLKPGSIAPNLNGRDVRAALALNGAFATPVVDYKIRAARLGFGETVVEQVYAEGRARVDADRILVPVRARAARVLGLNAAAGGLVTNLSIAGDLAISGDQILSDNLRLRSDRVDATAIIAADMSEGRYTGALKGRINDYEINGVGLVNLKTDAELFAAPGGGWGIRGQVAAETRRITNEAARNFLGGNAVASARVALNPSGIITFDNVRLRAPQFRVTSGSGRYDPRGPLLVNANAVSTQYGPLSARVSGTLTAPEVLLRAPRPGLGVGLVDLEARVRGRGNAYAITAKGGSKYGPFDANVVVRMGGALVVDIEQAHFAGMAIAGRVQQTAAGPFAGRVTFEGSGIVGSADLANQAGVQRADLQARALNAAIPGMDQFAIGRALISANVVLTDTPQIVADAQIANLRSGQFVLQTARAKINYQGGSGTAQLVANGSSGVPFRIAANAQMSPEQWLVALQGQGSGIRFRTASPARIAVGKDYRLLPTRIDFDQGTLRLAGSYGDGMAVQARLDRLDLSVVNGFVPGFGVGGTATGSLDFAQTNSNAFPSADARLRIDEFTRSSLASVSTPVDVDFVGKLLPDGGDARAIIKRGTTTVGRLVATMRPAGPGAGGWMERMMAAPLSGGVRYNGPAAVPFSLAGLANQQLSGALGLAADFSGQVNAPQLTGVVRADDLTYTNETYGTRLTNMKIDGRFSNDALILNSMTARAGDGTITAQGRVGLSAASGYPMELTADLRDAQLARSEALGATATGRLTVTKNAQVSKIEGNLTIPEARYEIIRQGAAEVPELTGIRRRSQLAANNNRNQQAQPSQAAGTFDLNIRVRADNRLFVSGMGLESEWSARINVGGTSAAPQVRGQLEIVRGTYSFASRRFEVERGVITFQGNQLTNPTIDLAASTTAEGITATLNVSGTAQAPQIAFTSSPNLPQEEVLARLFFGTNVTNLSATEAIQLAAAVNSLRGSGGGGLNPLGTLKSATGIDRLRILGADENSGRGTSLAAGKYLTDDIYIEIITDARGFTATQLEIALNRALSLLSQTGSFGGSSVSLRYSRDY
ncbi:translocation/assembly module TamB domain-containing protein [Sphingomonas sp. IC-56]|uniref:translocation/assembly module TamB domain-containing protein n=1 Tax=Sphingomonas sp. IC-56 TaxID=2898529 RepID=UPI001E64DA61|nr:translocation/assembly module TamB domain-containing protein [Sphingomonas sp. IC-56]MCD2325415.1 translocation/assembly module TamB domain-containing protein [Sphingomonas sp. IC-56]